MEEKQKKQSAFHATPTAGPIPQQIDLFGTAYPYSVSSDRKNFRAQSVAFLCSKDKKGSTLHGNLDLDSNRCFDVPPLSVHPYKTSGSDC